MVSKTGSGKDQIFLNGWDIGSIWQLFGSAIVAQKNGCVPIRPFIKIGGKPLGLVTRLVTCLKSIKTIFWSGFQRTSILCDSPLFLHINTVGALMILSGRSMYAIQDIIYGNGRKLRESFLFEVWPLSVTPPLYSHSRKFTQGTYSR